MLHRLLPILSFCLTHALVAQVPDPPLEHTEVPIELASGPAVNLGVDTAIVFAESVEVPGAAWLQLKFDRIALAEPTPGQPETILRITSLLDGAVQVLNAESARQWRNESAYFNGDAVLVEIIADPSAGESYVTASNALAGEPTTTTSVTTSICGPGDDRVLSSDPRVGRAMTNTWCTAFIIADEQKCLVSAGHCLPINSVQFNVPLSTVNSNIVHAHPDDQYAVDPVSMQSQLAGEGNDWAYFGVFPNSNTGLTPYEAQGNQAFQLATPPSPAAGTVRVTGYGAVSAPVDPRWHGAQKTHTGDFTARTGDVLAYTPDTTGGNSGGPVILEATDAVIGIHTNGGCPIDGTNSGTAIDDLDFANALANPLGVCAPSPRLVFTYTEGLPDLLHPMFDTFPVQITAVQGFDLDTTTPMLHYSTDGGANFQVRPLLFRGGSDFLVEFPLLACSSQVRFYISAETTDGIFETDKQSAPDDTHLVTTGLDTGWSTRWDFESQAGWSIFNTAETVAGIFERGQPVGAGFRLDPPFDADGSGQCFLTGNLFGDSDVDGTSGNIGLTWIKSPMITVPTLPSDDFYLWYSRWFGWSQSSGDTTTDYMRVYIRPEGSPSATLVDEVLPDSMDTNDGWKPIKINLNGIVAQNQAFQVEFYVADQDTISIVEAGIDDVRISQYFQWSICDGLANCPPDQNNDNLIDISDLHSVLEQWRGGVASGDMNGDQDVSVSDYVIFVKALGNCPE